ncbi:MAG: alpha/beta hydrolase [Sandaracinus sp.]|nr:alpha/beta hydrolase [Sandaracinus sp.]
MEPRVLPAERVRNALVRRLVRMPAPLARRLAGAPERDGRHALDPTLQLLLRTQKLAKEGGFDTKPSLAEARRSYHVLVHALERPARPSALELERTLAHDGVSVRARIHHPAPGQARPALVYFHGGGFVVGDLDTHVDFARRICRDADVVVVAVDYRLAPEHPFPAGVDDCVAATRAVLARASELGVDASKVGVAGDSAGGNLAVNVSQVVEGLAFQALIYPTTDVDRSTPSKARCAEGFGLDRTTVDWFTDRYLGRTDHADPRASPLLSSSLARCPRTHVALAGFDVLRDEGQLLADRLRELGVPTTVETHGGLIHGFVHLTRVPACDVAVDALVREIRKGLHA